jgi:hypothetical protein
MKAATFMSVALALGLFMAARAAADQSSLIMPKSAGSDAYFGYDDYYTSAANAPIASPAPETASPSDAAGAGGTPVAGCPSAGCDSCDPCGERPCRWCRCGELADPWTLPQAATLRDRNITVGGWIEAGIYGNEYGEPNNGPIGLRNVGDGFTADQLWIFAERKTDTGGSGWDVGGRIDYLFGADGPDTQSFGDRSWDYGWNSSRDYGSAIPQLYGEVAYNNLKVKFGHFYTPIGYEVVAATGNFFYSHSYSHTFGEPFTHTGALAEYAITENVKAYGGWVNGWDQGFAGDNHGSMFLGGLSLTISERASLAWFCSAGQLGDGTAFTGAASGDAYMNSFVFTYKLTDRWTYVFEHDLGTNYNVNRRTGVDNQWYEINNYVMYKVTDCLSYGGRFEWFQDPQGAKVVAGDRGNYYAGTVGLNWRPHANVAIRPEIRYDTFTGTAPAGGLPFNNGTSAHQFSLGTDFIFTF